MAVVVVGQLETPLLSPPLTLVVVVVGVLVAVLLFVDVLLFAVVILVRVWVIDVGILVVGRVLIFLVVALKLNGGYCIVSDLLLPLFIT